ncbi:MAG: 2-(acetamidomethylene)succinate hydrolase [Syntrophus sp. SKADARSKE-3]|nr:2-(acetamidomethylene)succinate hydrolase [Syntrophus sp. SKADARSKE-3]
MTICPEDKFVHIDGLRLHYLEWGNGRETAMLLLHGIGDDAHVWDHFAQNTADRIRIIALDQRGHGLSGRPMRPAYRCEDYVADIDKLTQTLQLDGVILMGHSMGALHATRYAAMRPDKVAGLIHADIEPCPPDWNKKYLLNLYENLPHFYESIHDYVREMKKNSPYADDGLLYHIASFAFVEGKDGKLISRFDREVLFHFDRYDLRPFLRDIRCPALIIRGQESRVMRHEIAKEMSDIIPTGCFAEISKVTHPVHLDNPVEFLRVVSGFLHTIIEEGA